MPKRKPGINEVKAADLLVDYFTDGRKPFTGPMDHLRVLLDALETNRLEDATKALAAYVALVTSWTARGFPLSGQEIVSVAKEFVQRPRKPDEDPE
jgi:hypothetical protein